MRLLWVLVLMAIVCQVPAATYVTRNGFACKTPDLWLKYATAIDKRDGKTIAMIRLSQRCVDIEPGEVQVLERDDNYLLIQGKANRKLYIPKAYIRE